MTSFLSIGSCFALLFAASCGIVVQTSDDDPGDDEAVLFMEDAEPAIAALPYVDHELLIQPYPGANEQVLLALYESNGATPAAALPEIDTVVLNVHPEQFFSIAQTLADSGLIETVQKNYLFQPEAIPNDPDYSIQLHFPQVGIPQAWDLTTGREDIFIAVLDTGLDADHLDLSDRIVGGWNVFNNNADYDDVVGHGTLVAGVMGAASNNGLGVSGVTWGCPLLGIRVSDTDGRASARHIAAGILWAVGHGARVINVSFAPLWSNRVVQSAVKHAFNRGSLVVISAGNAGGVNTSRGYSEALFVGAVDAGNVIASFSDTGPFVDLAAPGVALYSTADGGGYALASGTSFSAPMIAGIAALMWSANPNLRPTTIQSVLRSTATDAGAAGYDRSYGYGIVDAGEAVAEALRQSESPDATAPTVRITRPASGATISGRYVVRVEVSDAGDISDVVLSIDGVPYATDARSPFRFVVDTNEFSSGAHTLSAIASDSAGHSSAPNSVTVTFRPWSQTPGSGTTRITFTYPAEGAAVIGDVTIRVTLADADGLSAIEWMIDGVSVFAGSLSGTSSGVSFQWRTAPYPPGTHTITIRVIDGLGNTATGARTLTVP